MPSPRDASPRLQEALDQTVESVDKTIKHLLPETDFAEKHLFDAMRYGVLAGGKRLTSFYGDAFGYAL